MATRKEEYGLSTAWVVSDLKVDLQSGSGSTLYATWRWKRANTDHYNIVWRYYTANGVWFVGTTENLDLPSTGAYVRATYSAPANALRVSCAVQPIAATYQKQRGKETYEETYWTASTATEYYTFQDLRIPEVPSVPTVTINNNFRLVATVSNIKDPNTTHIEFQVVSQDEKTVKHGITTIATQVAIYGWDVDVGKRYKVRARGLRAIGRKGIGIITPSGATSSRDSWVTGGWSDYSSNLDTVPSTPEKITKHEVENTSSIFLYWKASKGNPTSYTVEYAVSNKYFNRSSAVKSATSSTNSIHITDLDYGKWYFRVKATNQQGDSGWSPIYSIILGVAPSAPTTWSETATAIVGETVRLYWMHNAEDGSSQKAARVQVKVDGATDWTNISIDHLATESGEASYTSYKTYSTILENLQDDATENVVDHATNIITVETRSMFAEGATIRWRVQTQGFNGEWSPWSTERVVTVYAPPTVEMVVSSVEGSSIPTSIFTSFPIYINATAAPASQSAVSWVLKVISNSSYEAYDDSGNVVAVAEGDELYSEYIAAESNTLNKKLTAAELDLVNNGLYTITLEVAMNSGLVASDHHAFTTSWSVENLWPNAEVAVDMDNLCAYIRPFCNDENEEPIEDVTLAVYRREYDGRYVEIASGLINGEGTTVTDPHPSLDYARYRIVATEINTGQVGFYDIPGYAVGETGIVIQWGEQWTDFNIPSGDGDGLANSVWAGSMLKLPYNINISEDASVDASLVEYIGRSSPVSYYGTQLGITGSWSTDVLANDLETRYALRRLQIWRGDAYVRAPNGVGYWANVKVSFSKDYKNLLMPVTLNITRVEGGI